ncbi:MAG: MFS transporter [Gammaproteobacteria bacterium]
MFKQYSVILALTATNGLLQMGHGALSALMIQQGGRLEFSETALGLLISATYVGFLASNAVLHRLLPRVSFIRTFAVCAAAISSFALLMPIVPSEGMWTVLRVLYGAFFCAMVVICDAWLNNNATRENRGKLWGMFMTVNYLSFGAGQYILIVGEKEAVHAFIVSAICLAVCLVPICLTRLPEPQPPARDAAAMRWRDAYAVAPVAFLGQFAFGVYTGATFLFISYVEGLGIAPERQATLAAMFFGFGFLMQIPIGWLADRVRDRRDVIIGVAAISGICAAVLGLGEILPYPVLALFIVLLGSVSCTLFSLNIAYGQDFVEREKSALYAGMLMRVYALGGLLGPPAAGFLMGAIAPGMLFWFCALVMGCATLATATNRLMPRYRPAHTAQFRPASPLTATSVAEDLVYSETDIGPELPEEEPAPDAPPSDIGPELPEEETPPEFAPSDVGPEAPAAQSSDEGGGGGKISDSDNSETKAD